MHTKNEFLDPIQKERSSFLVQMVFFMAKAQLAFTVTKLSISNFYFFVKYSLNFSILITFLILSK